MTGMTKKPKVSVCVITYNHEKYIRECLQSIVDQKTDFEIEIIVGDDCSHDRTRDIILDFHSKYPGKITPLFQKENLFGGCNNYRAVHRLARGDYIAHMDGDDMMEPGKLQHQSDFLDKHPECSMVAHDSFKLGLDAIRALQDKKKRSTSAGLNALLKEQCYFTHSSKMYRLSLRDKSEALSHDIFIDFELHVECAIQGRIGYINMPLVTYRETGSSITKSSNDKIFELFQYTLRGYDVAIKHGVAAKVAVYKSIYIYKSAIFFIRRGSIEYAHKCLAAFDEIPWRMRSLIFGIFLGGNFKSIRMPICRAIALVRSRIN
jgi:glycosyltransferase involved in cell wall biosynthesis